MLNVGFSSNNLTPEMSKFHRDVNVTGVDHRLCCRYEIHFFKEIPPSPTALMVVVSTQFLCITVPVPVPLFFCTDTIAFLVDLGVVQFPVMYRYNKK